MHYDSPPLSPAALSRKYQEMVGPKLLAESDATTASLNMDALKKIASQVVNKTCSGLYKIAQGGYNQVFIITFEDGSDIIARVNVSSENWWDAATPLQALEDRTASEIATLNFLREHTNIPVPRVLAFDCKTDNPVGARYSLQERIVGQRIDRFLDEFTQSQRDTLITQLAQFEVELIKFPWTHAGSIYQDPGSGVFYIGPLVPPTIPDFATPTLRGPWGTPHEMIKDFATSEMQYICENTDKWKADRLKRNKVNCDGDGPPPFEFMKVFFQIILSLIETIPIEHSYPCLLTHVDWNIHNMLMAYDDPTRVVGIFDWEGASVFPLCFWDIWPRYIYDFSNDSEERCRMAAVRDEVVGHANEALLHEDWDGVLLRDLSKFFFYQHSVFSSPKYLGETFMRYWARWSEIAVKHFQPLVDFIADSESSKAAMEAAMDVSSASE